MLAQLCLQKLKDWKLALAVVVFVLIDVITLLAYTIVEGLRGNLNAILIQNAENPSAEIGVRFIYLFYNHSFMFTLNNTVQR